MATVYLARDLKHERKVALKVLRPELSAAIGADRFLREIQLTARLNHPHIVPLLDSGDAGGCLYYVMPFATGESLRDRLDREGQIPVDEALTITREIADALNFAHSQGVIHRDIKPENVLIGGGHAVVADFGIARAVTAAGGDTLTETGIVVGTTAYMSPEQAAGSRDLDGRSDVYSLGCVLYEMLAGRPPFTGPTAASIVHQHMTAEPQPITSIRPAAPAWVAVALARSLAKTPADRFSSGARFAEALMGQAAPAVPIAASASGATFGRPAVRFALLAGAVVVVVGGAFMRYRAGREASAPAGLVYPRTAIAVLPFDNLSAETQQAYFAGGLHDELLTQLSKVAALTVRSRTYVMGYVRPNIPPFRQLASELEVGSYVEGSVQVVGNRLRVNVQLIDAATNAHLWAESYDRTLDDAFAIQSEIARQITTAVGATLTSDESQSMAAAPTANADAYRLYLQGREYWTRPGYSKQNYQIAQSLYERALTLDTSFALAHAALAEVHAMIYWNRYDRSPARSALQRKEAEAALRLAPGLPQGHLAMGTWHYFVQGDYPRALEEYRVALKGLPNDPEAWARFGQVSRRMGNVDDAVAAHEKTTQLAPRDANYFKELGVTYTWVRRYREAMVAYNTALTLAPDVQGSWVFKGDTYLRWRGVFDTLRVAQQLIGNDGSEFALQRLYWERQADSMVQLARTLGSRSVLVDNSQTLLPRSLYAARAHRLRGDARAARAAFDSARVFLDSALRVRPNDPAVHAALGLALAGLGRRDEALREARWLQRSQPYREDKFLGTHLAVQRARILAQLGDAGGALDELESLLSRPSEVSVHTLGLDPSWDPIRAHPRFQALLKKYALR